MSPYVLAMRSFSLFGLAVMLACTSSTTNDAGVDGSTSADATADTSTQTDSGSDSSAGCVGGMGGGSGTGGSMTCYQSFKCPDGTYRIDCACPAAACSCLAPDGGAYQTVAFDCDGGCGFPLPPETMTACGLK